MGESQAQTGNTNVWSIGYGYSKGGALASLSYPTGLAVTYNPNALGQPTQVASSTQTLASGISYFPNGALKQFTYGNGIVHTLTQNARGLPAISRDANGSTAIHQDEYAYDQNGNVLAIIDGVSGNRGDRDMTYDALDRLTDTTSPMYGTTGAHYTYDTLDNVTSITAPGRSGAFAQAYCYDQHQWLTNVKNNGDCSTGDTILGIGYDPQGNLANWNGVAYAFDYGNRLRSIAGIDAYRYDAWGRRVRQSNASGLLYSMYGRDGTLLWQRNERTGQRRNYVYLQGSLLAEHRRPIGSTTETIVYQHTDALGSPVATTDASKGVLETSEYEPYGKLLNRPMEDAPAYTGHVGDAGSSLVYMQERYYDPRTGRFWSTDPVTAYEQPLTSFNRYRYANNNPYKFADPDGREAGCVTLQTNCFDSGGTLGEKTMLMAGFATITLGALFSPTIGMAVLTNPESLTTATTIAADIAGVSGTALTRGTPLKTTADLLENAAHQANGSIKVSSSVLNEIGAIESKGGRAFSGLTAITQQSKPATWGGKPTGGLQTVVKYLDPKTGNIRFTVHTVTDAAGNVVHRDFDSVMIKSGQQVVK